MAKGISTKVAMMLLPGVISGTAVASGFQLQEQSASGIGNAFAGSAAVAENASTIYFNPAGMTQLQGVQVSGGVAAIGPSYKFSNAASSSTGGNGGDAGSWAGVPNGYASWGVTKDLYLGLGISAPFGLKTEYAAGWVGQQQSLKFDIKTINVNPSVAYRVNDAVSLGFGLNWQKIEAEYVRAVNAAGSQIKPDTDDTSWGWNAGALFTVSPSTKIGVSYRSAIKHKTTGKFSGVSNANAAADLKLPDTFIMSVTQKLSDKWEMLGDVSRTGWSSVPKVFIMNTTSSTLAQTLDTDFRNTWRVALGANYQYTEALKLKFGIAYDQSPVRQGETRLVSLPDTNRVWFSTGGQYRFSKASTLDLGVAYLYLRDPSINNYSNGVLVNGSYQGSIWIVGAQYSHAF